MVHEGSRSRWLGAVAAVVAALAPAAARPAPGSWRLVATIEVGEEVSAAAFLDERVGLAGHCIPAAPHPALLHTGDGGRTWAAARIGSACRFGLEVRPGRAWSSGDLGDVQASRDGGRSWTPAARFGGAIPNHATWLSFADDLRGAIASHMDVGVTGDGARSWSRAALPDGIGTVAGVSLSAEGAGAALRVLNPEGRMWASRDAGTTWAAAPTPLRLPLFEWADGVHVALRFPSAREGVLVAMVEEGELPVGRVYRTLDGGRTWTEEQVEGGLWPSPIAISPDGTLITSVDRGTVRLYRRTGRSSR